MDVEGLRKALVVLGVTNVTDEQVSAAFAEVRPTAYQTWKEVYFAARAKWNLSPEGAASGTGPGAVPTQPQRRQSLTRSADDNLPLHDMDSVFPFRNREAQCKQLYDLFMAMDCVRKEAALSDLAENTRWESFKREIQVPLCMGISGIGKSSFAREGAWYALQCNNFEPLSPFQKLLQAAYTQGQNYRIPCDYLAGMSGDVSEVMAQYILYESCKPKLRRECTAFRVFANTLQSLSSALPPLTIIDALQLIADEYPDTAILVNIDEAQHIAQGDGLRTVLQQLGTALISNIPVFFTVTGLQQESVVSATFSSGMAQASIQLPPLQATHMWEIVWQIMPSLKELPPNAYFEQLCWFCGGVPRLLAYTLEAIAKRTHGAQRFIPSSALSTAIMALEEKDFDDLQVMLRPTALRGELIGLLPPQALQAVVALSLTSTPVAPSQTIITSGTKAWRVQDALDAQIAYLRTSEGGATVLSMPPSYTRAVYDQSLFPHLPSAAVMGGATLTTRGNETRLPTVLLYRLQAAALLGRTSVTLGELCLVHNADRLSKRAVKVPKCFKLDRVSDTVTSANFKEYAVRARAAIAINPTIAPCVLVNMPKAAFADAFALLEDATSGDAVNIFIQEKQSVTARRRVIRAGLDRSRAPLGATEKAVYGELKKVKTAMDTRRDLFLYVSDCGPHRLPRLPTAVRIIRCVGALSTVCGGKNCH